mmetsp:Transcript_61819/g.116980  ORF Transcript_61819/g.116980 Transcript_61819/m.116980 type:complete len:207 (+) Transcript_61819:170-790(+)
MAASSVDGAVAEKQGNSLGIWQAYELWWPCWPFVKIRFVFVLPMKVRPLRLFTLPNHAAICGVHSPNCICQITWSWHCKKNGFFFLRSIGKANLVPNGENECETAIKHTHCWIICRASSQTAFPHQRTIWNLISSNSPIIVTQDWQARHPRPITTSIMELIPLCVEQTIRAQSTTSFATKLARSGRAYFPDQFPLQGETLDLTASR